MPRIPSDKSPDSTLALLREPYDFIAKRCRRHGADLFETRLLLRRTICMSGPEAAELFYDPHRFVRHGAMPIRIQETLLGRGGVQSLDSEAHRHRKQVFMALMEPEHIVRLGSLSGDYWRAYFHARRNVERFVLYDAAREVLTRAVCEWAGVPLAEPEVARRVEELTALFQYAGAVGVKHWRARYARRHAERWAAELIEQVRASTLRPPAQSALRIIASHRALDGQLLSSRIAAVELLNVLRPTIAVAVFITFAAHALHQYPECRRKLKAGDEDYAALFVQEVRRFYPFFPAVAARVQDKFEWKGYEFPRGRRVMLDLYGTNHDPRTWEAPQEFHPERFLRWDQSPFNFIPQGGGDHNVNHRCPGEWITLELMKIAVRFFTQELDFDVPAQDLRLDRTKLPALPRSGFIIGNTCLMGASAHSA